MGGPVDGNPGGARADYRTPDHRRDQQRPSRGRTPEDGETRRPSRSPASPRQRNEVRLTLAAHDDLKQLKRRDISTYNQVNKLLDTIEQTPDLGYPLRDEWEGCLAVHCGRDRYRVIWEILAPEEDYSGATDKVIPVAILRIGPKNDSHGRTIYDEGRLG